MISSINRLIIAQAFRTLIFAGPIFTLFLLAKGLSLQQTLTILSILILSGLIFEIPTGVFADKYGRKWSMVAGSFLSASGWFIWLNINTFFGFAFIYALFGLANAFCSGSDQALIYDELKSIGRETDAQRVFSRYNGTTAAAYGIAAFIGGFIASTHNLATYYTLFKMTFIASLIGFLFTLTIKETKHTAKGEAISHKEQCALQQFSAGLRLLKNNKKLRKIALFSTFAIPFALMELYQVYFQHADVPASWYGYSLTISSILIAFTKWHAYRLEGWFGVEKSMMIISTLQILLFCGKGVIIHPIAAIILFISADVIGNTRDPILTDYQNRHIEGHNRATVLSTISLLNNGYVAIMLPIIGWIADKNLSSAFLIITAIIIFGNLAFRIKSDDVIIIKE
jgi:MFS family permease